MTFASLGALHDALAFAEGIGAQAEEWSLPRLAYLTGFLQGEGDWHGADWPKGHQPTPNIQPSTCATVLSGGVKLGFRNAARPPSWSARESQAAML